MASSRAYRAASAVLLASATLVALPTPGVATSIAYSAVCTGSMAIELRDALSSYPMINSDPFSIVGASATCQPAQAPLGQTFTVTWSGQGATEPGATCSALGAVLVDGQFWTPQGPVSVFFEVSGTDSQSWLVTDIGGGGAFDGIGQFTPASTDIGQVDLCHAGSPGTITLTGTWVYQM
jgi:hypothetical protein